jgi:hypothetical protein
MIEFRRKIHKIEIAGLGTVSLKAPSIAVRTRIQEISSTEGDDGKKYLEAMAHAVQACLLGEDGKPAFASVDELKDEMDIEAFNALSSEVVKLFTPKEDTAKNSESGQNSSLPSTSPES